MSIYSNFMAVRVTVRLPAIRLLPFTVVHTFCLLVGAGLVAQDERVSQDVAKAVGLEHLAIITNPALPGIVSVECSQEGRQLYVSSFKTHSVAVFNRDPKTGQIKHQQSISDATDLGGALCLRLSPSSQYGVTTCLYSKTVALFKRDELDGSLKLLDVVRNDFPGPPLLWTTDAAFSPDSQFVYVLDARGAALAVFRIAEGRNLEWIETNVGRDRCFDNARGIAMHPDGRTVFVASPTSGTLAIVDRDTKTGRLTVRELIDDGAADIRVLDGVMGVCCSPDGQFVYTSSGRFEGAHTVATFRVEPDRKLSILQAFLNGEGVLQDFRGGNEITISPDGLNLYAAGTLSGSLACFRRDPGTGKLTYLGTLRDETTGAGLQLGACGLTCSPDGQFLYVTLEDQGAVSIFRRAQPAR